jgi:hypothetical protein
MPSLLAVRLRLPHLGHARLLLRHAEILRRSRGF